MAVSENKGIPKSSIFIWFSNNSKPFWGIPIFGNTLVQLPGFFQPVSKWMGNGEFQPLNDLAYENLDVPGRKLVTWLVNGLFHLLTNGVY